MTIPQLAFSFHNRNERTATSCSHVNTLPFTTFQFPQSERTNCNELNVSHKRSLIFLSVSTIGTNELQHQCPHCRCRANDNFQFPQSERTNCNLQRRFHRRRNLRLSVSTIGTNELQLGVPVSELADLYGTFSFHNRNERTATNLDNFTPFPTDLLSVSTIGTNELQPLLDAPRYRDLGRFQFPQSERTNCNSTKPDRQIRERQLSVSTIGTNELQRIDAFYLLALFRTFSFHNRNERTATSQKPLAEKIQDAFSFHNRNERTATQARTNSAKRASHFQFPQSERTNCNTSRRRWFPRKLTFQFPQSERTNCNFFWRFAEQRDRRFQFPQSERTNCNCELHAARPIIFYLSVSTIGTNELQRKLRD